jgi:hypothetical protein
MPLARSTHVKLSERLMPTLVVVLLAAVLAPLCVAAGLDGGEDPCCQMGAQLASTSWIRAMGSAMAVVLGAIALALGVGLDARRVASTAMPHFASSPALSAVPLRI